MLIVYHMKLYKLPVVCLHDDDDVASLLLYLIALVLTSLLLGATDTKVGLDSRVDVIALKGVAVLLFITLPSTPIGLIADGLNVTTRLSENSILNHVAG